MTRSLRHGGRGRKQWMKSQRCEEGRNKKWVTTYKNEEIKITWGWTSLSSCPAPSPMCMVGGCFLTILRRARSCFLHTEPLLEAQSCCSRPFLWPTLLHTSSQNVTTLARVLIELGGCLVCGVHVCMCVSVSRQNEELNDKEQNNASPTFPESLKPSHSLSGDLQRRPDCTFLYFTAPEMQQFIAALWFNC